MSELAFSSSEDWEKFNSSLLIEVTRPRGVFTCTGVAVSPTLLVTAAHCLEGEIKSVRIFTGAGYDPKAPGIAVEKFELHPQYNPRSSAYKNDIAKIILKEKLPDSVRICSFFEGKDVKGKIYRFGFGARNKKNLRTVITPTYRRINETDSVVELDDTFSRSGDSGGPVFVEDGTAIKLLAIHSTFSHGPLGKFSFNPMIQSYRSWIFPN